MKLHVRSPLFGLLCCGLLVSGCVISVDPVVPESESVFDARLIGRWETSDVEFAEVFTAGKEYSIRYVSHGKEATLGGRLGRLNDRLILDVWPTPADGDLPDTYAGLMVAGHLVLELRIQTDSIRTRLIGPDSLLAALESGAVPLKYRLSENQLILSAATGNLRSALTPYLASPEAFVEPTVWRRATVSETGTQLPASGMLCLEPSSWFEADRLFHRDPHWVGADGASTVDLGAGRILWLFGDTWIDPSGSNRRGGASLVSNTVAIQQGPNPTEAEMSFYWGRTSDGSPDAFFPDRNSESLWPGSGVVVDDKLVLFFARTMRGTGTGLGFEHPGWAAVMVENPEDEPSKWRIRHLETPSNPLGVMLGFAAGLKREGFVYAFGSQNPVKSHPIFVARWPVEEIGSGDVLNPEWWTGETTGWVPDTSDIQRWPLFENGASELSIHRDHATDRFVGIQTEGFGPADVMLREAPKLTGPWSPAQWIFRPPEYDRPNVMIYAGKAHPELTGGDIVMTYATNTFSIHEQFADSLSYYPHFVRLTRCKEIEKD